jgi:hypothetical protein
MSGVSGVAIEALANLTRFLEKAASSCALPQLLRCVYDWEV